MYVQVGVLGRIAFSFIIIVIFLTGNTYTLLAESLRPLPLGVQILIQN